MLINIKTFASATIARKSTDLFTRYIGRMIFEKIKEKLHYISKGEVLVIDFDGIRSIDASFVDECIVPLLDLSHSVEIPFYVKVSTISDNVEYVIHQVLNMSKGRKRYVVTADRLCSNGCHALGGLSDAEKDVIEYCAVNKMATISDIASFLHLPEDKAMEVCDALYAVRVIKKSEDARIFYSVL